jgi:protein-S-isoprenylcysteine O-methyltransferase Ste14
LIATSERQHEVLGLPGVPRASGVSAFPAVNVMTDLVARAVIVVLFSAMSYNLLGEFLQTGHLTGLLLLTSEATVVVLTLVRRRPQVVDRSPAGLITTALSIAGPPLLRAVDGVHTIPDAVTAAVSALGLGVVVFGKVMLGRSFGIAPANRGIVARGPYLIVRHPIYAGYLLTHLAFLVAHPSPWNAAVILIADGALVMRALIEERVLSADEQYRSYCRRVSWHLVPGLF